MGGANNAAIGNLSRINAAHVLLFVAKSIFSSLILLPRSTRLRLALVPKHEGAYELFPKSFPSS
jgi:hypothetical protein